MSSARPCRSSCRASRGQARTPRLVRLQRHRAEPEQLADPRLQRRAVAIERGGRASAAAEHRDEEPRLDLPQPLHVAAQLVDPHGDLRAERRRHRVLSVRAAGDRVVLRALGESGERLEQPADLREHDAVGLADLQEVARLGDVLRRRAPVGVAAGIALAEPVELPHQRDQAVPRDAQALGHAVEVEQLEPRPALDLRRGRLGNHADLGLGPGERDLDVEPRLPARLAREEIADAGVADTQRGRSVFGHRAPLDARRCYAIDAASAAGRAMEWLRQTATRVHPAAPAAAAASSPSPRPS